MAGYTAFTVGLVNNKVRKEGVVTALVCEMECDAGDAMKAPNVFLSLWLL